MFALATHSYSDAPRRHPLSRHARAGALSVAASADSTASTAFACGAVPCGSATPASRVSSNTAILWRTRCRRADGLAVCSTESITGALVLKTSPNTEGAEYRNASLHPNGGVGHAYLTARPVFTCTHSTERCAAPSRRQPGQSGCFRMPCPPEPSRGSPGRGWRARRACTQRAPAAAGATPARRKARGPHLPGTAARGPLLEPCRSTNCASELNAAGQSLTARERPAGEIADDLACSAAAPQPCRPIRPKAVRAQPGALPLQALALQSWALPSHAVAAVAAAAAAASAEAHQAALAAHSAFYVPGAAAACEAPAAAGERQAAGSAEAGGSAMSTLLEAIGVLGACTWIEVPLQQEEAV